MALLVAITHFTSLEKLAGVMVRTLCYFWQGDMKTTFFYSAAWWAGYPMRLGSLYDRRERER